MRSLYGARPVPAQDLPPSGNAAGEWLLRDRKQGKWVHYRLSPQMPAWAAQVIEQAWLSQQDDVRLMISRLTDGPGCR